MATWSLNQQGRRPVKFPSPLFKGGRGPGAAPRPPSAEGGTPSGGSFFLCFFLFAIEKERRKPSALHRERHPGRGAAGLLVTNGDSRLELKSPPGRCQGAARTVHQKHPGGMFLRAVGRACEVSLMSLRRSRFTAGLPVHWRWAFLWCKGIPPLQKAPAAPLEQRGPCFTYLLAGGAYSST